MGLELRQGCARRVISPVLGLCSIVVAGGGAELVLSLWGLPPVTLLTLSLDT